MLVSNFPKKKKKINRFLKLYLKWLLDVLSGEILAQMAKLLQFASRNNKRAEPELSIHGHQVRVII